MRKNYILKKDCPNIHKEEGDCYNNEYADSIEDLLLKGIIIEEENECTHLTDDFEMNEKGEWHCSKCNINT